MGLMSEREGGARVMHEYGLGGGVPGFGWKFEEGGRDCEGDDGRMSMGFGGRIACGYWRGLSCPF